jgi:hypothetical protein
MCWHQWRYFLIHWDLHQHERPLKITTLCFNVELCACDHQHDRSLYRSKFCMHIPFSNCQIALSFLNILSVFNNISHLFIKNEIFWIMKLIALICLKLNKVCYIIKSLKDAVSLFMLRNVYFAKFQSFVKFWSDFFGWRKWTWQSFENTKKDTSFNERCK